MSMVNACFIGVLINFRECCRRDAFFSMGAA